MRTTNRVCADAEGNGMPFKCRDQGADEQGGDGGEQQGRADPCKEKNVFDNIVDPDLSKVCSARCRAFEYLRANP